MRRLSGGPRPHGILLRRRDVVMRRKPDLDSGNVRISTLRRTRISRRNLVEMRGRLGFHDHPDRVCAWHGSGRLVVLGPGDDISIPENVPHKYATVTPTALLLSFDAPPYDPRKTRAVPEEGVEFEPDLR